MLVVTKLVHDVAPHPHRPPIAPHPHQGVTSRWLENMTCRFFGHE